MDGDVYFGGHSITQYRLERLREAIGYVPQDHFLFLPPFVTILLLLDQMRVKKK